MIFNSIPFFVFFIVVFIIYWSLQKYRYLQNIVLLFASYFFYGYASWKMIPLLLLCTIAFYFIGIAININMKKGTPEGDSYASLYTTIGVVLGISLLAYFKYLNFFIDEFSSLLKHIGINNNIHSFGIIMPLGISFFTFKLISYVLDIHHSKQQPSTDFISFATYISFFPTILSGPIDKPQFINQLDNPRIFKYEVAVDGCRQILWGLFKKLVIADNCALYVEQVWSGLSNQSGSTLILTMILYSIQLYSDFSGYSDMAIGVGKLLGLKITTNFKTPFFALNVADFWRRWHMSLTQWLTDYVFMPLNIKFRDWGNWGLILAILINMELVGIWHGANWTYALFGIYHGFLFIPLILTGAFSKKSKIRTYSNIDLPFFSDFCKILLTFSLVCIGQLIFRAENIGQIGEYIYGIFDKSLFSIPWLHNRDFYVPTFGFIGLMILIEWINRSYEHGLSRMFKYKWLNWVIYYILIFIVYKYQPQEEIQFIYFQF